MTHSVVVCLIRLHLHGDCVRALRICFCIFPGNKVMMMLKIKIHHTLLFSQSQMIAVVLWLYCILLMSVHCSSKTIL